MVWTIVCLTNFVFAMLNYHHSHQFQEEPLRWYFLVAGPVVPMIVGRVMSLKSVEILRVLPWCLIFTTVICSLWYRFGPTHIVEVDVASEKQALGDVERDTKIT